MSDNQKPLSIVLAFVPGGNIGEKAQRIGVSRQTIWWWLTGRKRPSAANCQRLAELTGIPAREIYYDDLRRLEDAQSG